MLQVYKRMQKMREKYVDTLAKLYEYATTVYSKKQYTQWYDTKEGGYTFGSFKSKCDSVSKKLTQYGIGVGVMGYPVYNVQMKLHNINPETGEGERILSAPRVYLQKTDGSEQATLPFRMRRAVSTSRVATAT